MNGPVFGIPPDLRIGPAADSLPLAGEVNWGMSAFAVDYLRLLSDGGGVLVGVVDSGCDTGHPLLSHVVGRRDFTGSPAGPDDRHGHGTHCSGTVGATDPRIGVAPGCRIVHGKGLGDSGSGSSQALIGAMRWCAAQGAQILSCSWGSSQEDPAITQCLAELAAAGVWPIFAAGNSGDQTPDVDWPGRSEHCIDVAALNPDLTPASFSSGGAKIDTSGPGVQIWSCAPGGGFRQMSGTSMATPFAAGVLALFRAGLVNLKRPAPSLYDLRAILAVDSTDTHTPGDDRRTGPGWITPLLLALALTPDPPPVE